MVHLVLLSISLFVLASCSLAEQVITADLVGELELEVGTLPVCSERLSTYYGRQSESGIPINFYGNDTSTSTSCSLPSGQSLIRTTASSEVFGSAAQSIGDVLTSSIPYPCITMSFAVINGSTNGTNPFPQPSLSTTNITITGVVPSAPVTVNGVILSTKKRYLFATDSVGYCIYSAPKLKHVDIRGSYNLVRSPLLKTPPSYCKSSLEIRGILGEANATEMLFDGRPDPCLKGRFSFIQPFNITFPVVTKLAQGGIPYYGYSESMLTCGTSNVYAGAVEISVDASLANIASIRGARYFGMVDMGPRENYTGVLENMRVCIYTSYTGRPNSVWTWIGTLFGW